ncbi:MAG: hypothetical protein WA629_00735 [Candidatus Aquilonibacter sp.]
MLRTNDEQGVARPPRTSQNFLADWGPALLTAALTLFALLCASMPP